MACLKASRPSIMEARMGDQVSLRRVMAAGFFGSTLIRALFQPQASLILASSSLHFRAAPRTTAPSLKSPLVVRRSSWHTRHSIYPDHQRRRCVPAWISARHLQTLYAAATDGIEIKRGRRRCLANAVWYRRSSAPIGRTRRQDRRSLLSDASPAYVSASCPALRPSVGWL
jgi:hypothetical protein